MALSLSLSAIGSDIAPSAKSLGDPEASIPSGDVVPSALVQLPILSNYYSPYAFVVDKEARTLSVWQQTANGLKRVAYFPADLGKAAGDKRHTGDHRTPEGVYFMLERLEGVTLDFKLYGQRAFTLDYPNFFDRLERKTGYGIWLHAVPDDVRLTRGSRGCVVVRNNVIGDLTKYVRLGRTPVIIQDKANYVARDRWSKTATEVASWLESWRTAWESKDINTYMSKYGEEFNSLNMNRDQWRDYKNKLNSQYQQISVRISRPVIYADRESAIVRFLQEYTSDRHTDFGEKVLYLKKQTDGYRIIGETWASENSQLAREEIGIGHHSTTVGCVTPDCKSTSAN